MELIRICIQYTIVLVVVRSLDVREFSVVQTAAVEGSDAAVLCRATVAVVAHSAAVRPVHGCHAAALRPQARVTS